jgi:elongation factor 2
VTFCETVTSKGPICLSKSPNHHNRIWVQASPLPEDLIVEIDQGGIIKEDPKARGKKLVEKYGWNATDSRKIWAFAPDEKGPNILVDCTKGVQYMNEVSDSVCAAFAWVSRQGALTESSLRGVRYSITDMMLHPDRVHRGGGQIVPSSRRAFLASQLTAEPRLVEPIFLVEIQCTEKALNGVHSTLNARRGSVFDVADKNSGYALKAHLPVVESFGFAESLREHTSGQAQLQCTFSHWKTMEESPFEEGKVATLIAQIRKKKGLALEIPPLEKFLDKL